MSDYIHSFENNNSEDSGEKSGGFKLAAELMAIRPDIPVILCTGFSEQITEDEAQKMGIRKFILKPMIMKTLAGSVRQVLDRR